MADANFRRALDQIDDSVARARAELDKPQPDIDTRTLVSFGLAVAVLSNNETHREPRFHDELARSIRLVRGLLAPLDSGDRAPGLTNEQHMTVVMAGEMVLQLLLVMNGVLARHGQTPLLTLMTAAMELLQYDMHPRKHLSESNRTNIAEINRILLRIVDGEAEYICGAAEGEALPPPPPAAVYADAAEAHAEIGRLLNLTLGATAVEDVADNVIGGSSAVIRRAWPDIACEPATSLFDAAPEAFESRVELN